MTEAYETAVLIACKNGEATIGNTVRSAVGQADVYVVSDGSTDQTCAVAEAMGAHVLECTTSSGKPMALRAGNARFALAARYRRALAADGVDVVPEFDTGHVYHLFVVRTAARRELQAHLAARGIETLIHYPVPIPRQPALAGVDPAECPIASRACEEILSLPLHPAMADGDIDFIAEAVRAFAPQRQAF